jgi:hypothetical protein
MTRIKKVLWLSVIGASFLMLICAAPLVRAEEEAGEGMEGATEGYSQEYQDQTWDNDDQPNYFYRGDDEMNSDEEGANSQFSDEGWGDEDQPVYFSGDEEQEGDDE